MRTATAVLLILTLSWSADARQAPADAHADAATPRTVEQVMAELRERRAEARERALHLLADGDALDAYLAIDDAMLLTRSDDELLRARREAHALAVAPALRLAAAYEADGRSDRALDLLLRLRDGGPDPRLDAAILRARAGRALDRAALMEAGGDTLEAARICLLAANIAPGDERVLAALERLRTGNADVADAEPAPPADAEIAARNAPPASLAPPADVAGEQIARMALERRVDRLDSALARALTEIERLGGDITLRPGAAQPAVIELDRRFNDAQRELQRNLNDLRREVDRLSRDVQSLRREVDRLR